MNSNLTKRLESAARALAKKPAITVKLRGNDHPADLNESEIITLPGGGDLSVLRGEADLAALSLRYHNPKVHASMRPSLANAGVIFDALERTRIEILGSQHWQGVRANLASRLETHCRMADVSDVLALMLREKVLGLKPPGMMAEAVAGWSKRLDARVGKLLEALAQHTGNQKEYAATVNTILKALELAGKQEGKSEPTQDQNAEQDAAPSQAPTPQEESEEESTGAESISSAGAGQESFTTASASAEMPPDDAQQVEYDAPSYPSNALHPDFYSLINEGYHQYTTQFDEIVDADKLATPEEIVRLRGQLDQKLSAFHSVTSKLAARLQRLLLAKQARIFEYDLDEGLIDGKRLANLIINPEYQHIYRREKETDFRDTIVTLLIDNSGSMRGRPITVAALCADILARTLERCGVKVEILGFTTRDWKGGQSRKSWLEHERPINPGRLNDLRHIIYKAADMRWQKARRNMGVMLKDGILKENIDGEAIIWAHQRLMARPEQRRILMVISDGAPVDDSTLSSNNGSYLDRHLWQVINTIEERSDVELLAIGIGHDVTRYYKRAVTISDVSQLGDVMAKELVRLFMDD
ncbi:MAG TPA: hypothetical protein VFT64_08280 [Rickettsiales bacterium]|nr:hypothetical protein [Rickettsiales bacterium]